jgi:hypothetical protein
MHLLKTCGFALLAMISQQLSADELLTNPNFDSWSDGQPTGWTLKDGIAVSEINSASNGNAVSLEKGGSNTSQSLIQNFELSSRQLTARFVFSQAAPQNGERAFNISLRPGDEGPYSSIRVNADGTLESYDGSAWQAIAGTTGAIQSSDYSDNDLSNDTLYELEVAYDLSSAALNYALVLRDLTNDTTIADLTGLTYWQSTPSTELGTFRIALERGRGDSDWHVYTASIEQGEEAEAEPPAIDETLEHPFLLVKESEFPEWRERMTSEPWATIGQKAISVANNDSYDVDFTGDYRMRVLQLKTIVSACALAAILDPDNADAHYEKAAAQLLIGLNDITDTTSSGWNANTPVGSALFSSILALDIIHDTMSDEDLEEASILIDELVNGMDRSTWLPSPQSVAAIWALYRGDSSTATSNINSFKTYLLDMVTDDGVMIAGTGYGNARLNYFDREQKHALVDVLDYLGLDNPYEWSNLQKAYEWLYGYAYGHNGELHIFGDTSTNRYVYGPPGDYPEDSPTASYRAWRFSENAQGYANFLHASQFAHGTILAYATAGEANELIPAVSATSRIFDDGGAFFREDTTESTGLSSVLWNVKYDSSFSNNDSYHSHKEVNSLSIVGFGEQLLSNIGYAGARAGVLGYTWNDVNFRAASNNVVMIDYPLTSTKGLTSTNDHTLKFGAGISRGFVNTSFDFAVGSSGSALSNGTHDRGISFIHPQDGLPGYWGLFDHIESDSGSDAHLMLRPYSSDVVTVEEGNHYRWHVQIQTEEGAYLSIFPSSGATQTQLLDSLFGLLPSTESFEGICYYGTYPIENNTADLTTVLFPHVSESDAPISTQLQSADYQGLQLQLDSNTIDTLLSLTDESTPVTVQGSRIQASRHYERSTSGNLQRVFQDQGSLFIHSDGTTISATTPITYVADSEGMTLYLSEDSTITVNGFGAEIAYIDSDQAGITATNDGSLTFTLTAGEHSIVWNQLSEPSLSVFPTDTGRLIALQNLRPNNSYTLGYSSDLMTWDSMPIPENGTRRFVVETNANQPK